MSVHRGGAWSRGAAPGEVRGRGGLLPAREFCSQQGGVGGSVPGLPGRGGSGPRGVPVGEPPPRTATAEGGTHPTGMHSCLENANIDCKNNHLLP